MHPPSEPKYAGVVLDDAVDKLLDYEIPSSLQSRIQIGSRVIVPVNTSHRKATVWSLKTHSSIQPIKLISELASDQSILTQDLILLAEWISSYYSTPMHRVLTVMLPPSIRNHMKEKTQKVVKRRVSEDALFVLHHELSSSAPPQAKILQVLLDKGDAIPKTHLLKWAKVSDSPLQTLIKKNILSLEEATQDRTPSWDEDYFLSKPKILSEEQKKALEKIVKDLEALVFSSHLLYGVTGSGKTEIYLQAIEHALKLGRGVIFLVPEIVLTSQTIERIKSRFQEKIAVLHHRLSEGEKRDTWHLILSKQARIVIGARSAIFCPVPDLGLILVDEEHESAYKQSEESPCYHARDVALVRGKLCKATVVLGSATPSLESYQNALLGKYQLSSLTQRPDSIKLPKVHIVDMKQECLKQKKQAIFSTPLLSAIEKRIASGEQTLLLLNRRGYHTSQICLHCSYISICPQCDAPLTFHLEDKKLSCHLCDYQTHPLTTCPSCSSPSPMKFRGFGTEMVEKALYAIFPQCRILRMDADTTRKKGSHESIFKKFRSGKADILVGTQMIAKGLHFPSVTLVGVLNADLTLNVPDFRASERVFQLLTQVAGRSGRSELPGEVFIQTLLPTQPTLLQAAEQNYALFFQEELETRKLFSYPPFTHLIKITLWGPDQKKTEEAAQGARHFLITKLPSAFEIFPVTACGHAKIENHYRFQFLIKAPKVLAASKALFLLQQQFKGKSIQISLDIDPSSTFF